MCPGLSVPTLSFCQLWSHCTVDTRTNIHHLLLLTGCHYNSPIQSFWISRVTKQSSKPSYQTSLCTFRIPISFTSSICTKKYVTTALHQPWFTRYLTKSLTKSLTCCGLQKQQGEETADQGCTLHDGCQENADSLTDYIYWAGRLKAMQREEAGLGMGQLVEGLGSVHLRCCRSHGMPQGLYVYGQLALLFREAADWVSTSVLRHLEDKLMTINKTEHKH